MEGKGVRYETREEEEEIEIIRERRGRERGLGMEGQGDRAEGGDREVMGKRRKERGDGGG